MAFSHLLGRVLVFSVWYDKMSFTKYPSSGWWDGMAYRGLVKWRIMHVIRLDCGLEVPTAPCCEVSKQ
jgi:hypothetical protein